MNKVILFIFTLSLLNTSFAASCRKQVKNCKYKMGQAQMSLDKAIDFYDRHEVSIEKRQFELAKKYIDLSLERVQSAISKYEVAKDAIESTLENCPRRSKRLNSMLIDAEETTEDLSFQVIILDEISQRL